MSAAADSLPERFALAADALADRVVLVTGASGGLGRASALACARAGAVVVLLGRKVVALETLYDEIVQLQRATPAIYPLNLEGATPNDYETLAETIERECGRLDGIVHAAAHLAGLMPAEQISAQEWMRSLHINLSAPFLLTQACQPLLSRSGDASVIFVLDDPQRMAKAFWGGYGVAKAGLTGLVSILHQEWEATSIRVHAVIPPPMRTALRRMAYFGEDSRRVPPPDATAQAVAHLLGVDGAGWRGRVLDLRDNIPE